MAVRVDEELTKRVSAIQWWHRIDLGGGLVTPGLQMTQRKLEAIDMPEDLTGWSVLDVGAWDGFFSFEAEKRGAARVLATDCVAWQDGGRRGFDLARDVLDSAVSDATISVYDITEETVGRFDMVLFLGVFYHLWHPMLALERLFGVTDRLLMVETAIGATDYDKPAMVFHKAAWDGDDSNWWLPNPSAVIDMLETVGFERVGQVPPKMETRAAFHAWKDNGDEGSLHTSE